MKVKRNFGICPRDEDKFAGEYIAVVKGKIVAHGKDPKLVIREGKKGMKEPLLTKVPTQGWKEAMVLCLKFDLFKGKEIKIPEFGVKWIPTAQLRLITRKGMYLCEMMIDSGADISLIPRSLGEFLGFSFRKDKIREIRGIGEGAVPYTIKTVRVKISTYSIHVRIGIALIEEIPLILGRLDVFDHFNVEFRQKERITILRPTF